jgi:DnaK suppressor protein
LTYLSIALTNDNLMNLKTIDSLKKELVEKRDSLRLIQSQTRKSDIENESELKDVVDRSDAEEAWFTKERMNQHWKLELIRIDNALNRMESGTFGICEDCEEEIPLKRLRVRPDATLCLNCQETNEREASQLLKSNQSITLFH